VPNNPVFAPIPNPNCNTTSLVFSLDQNFACGSLNLSNINIFGPSNPVVSNVQALNCNNGLSNTIQIDLAAPLSSNGNYSVQFSNDFIDDCGNSWNLDAFGSFAISNCPISVIIEADDAEICFGTCTDLEAIAWGGNGNYSFTWSNGLGTGAGPKQVCPLVTSTYTVTVVDGSNAPAGQAQITVEVIPQAVLPADFTVCQSDPNINLDAVPNTGYWTAPCIGNDTILGIFHPAWCGTGIKKVYYHYGTCLDSMNITITPMSVGNTNQLVCPTTPAFNIFTNNPGGVWTGPGITNTALGTFDPSLVGPGVYNINYSKAPCADLTKIITVGTPTLPADDTLCLNHPLFTPNFSPQGGTWTGPGVTNSYWCRFNASIAGPGLHSLVYTFGACTDTLKIYVQEIDAGSNLVVCPSQSAFTFSGFTRRGHLVG
jgi:hypothetical protein